MIFIFFFLKINKMNNNYYNELYLYYSDNEVKKIIELLQDTLSEDIEHIRNIVINTFITHKNYMKALVFLRKLSFKKINKKNNNYYNELYLYYSDDEVKKIIELLQDTLSEDIEHIRNIVINTFITHKNYMKALVFLRKLSFLKIQE